MPVVYLSRCHEIKLVRFDGTRLIVYRKFSAALCKQNHMIKIMTAGKSGFLKLFHEHTEPADDHFFVLIKMANVK
jgi:hypothetical protein